jgi:hypothetical protein
MWNLILLFIQYGPALISLIREILKLIDELTPDEKAEAHDELQRAVDAYKLFGKDKKPITDLRDRLKRKCEGKKCSRPD